MIQFGRMAAGALALLSTTAALAGPVPYAHVLLISIDGMHALDLATMVARHPDGPLARLSRSGITYRQAMTPLISDSFPGLAAQFFFLGPANNGV